MSTIKTRNLLRQPLTLEEKQVIERKIDDLYTLIDATGDIKLEAEVEILVELLERSEKLAYFINPKYKVC